LQTCGWKFELKKEVNMRYVKPTIINTVVATIAIQGAKDGIPGDSGNMDERSVGTAYPVDE
jgi:hypothetical protein